MKKSLVIATVGVLLSAFVFAQEHNGSQSCDLQSDRCSGQPLTSSQFNKTIFLADKINGELESLYEKQKENGQDLKVVIIGRMGSDLSKFKILNDENGSKTLSEIIKTLIENSKNINSDYQGLTQSQNQSINYQELMSQINKKESLKYSHLGIAFRNFELKDSEGISQTGAGTGKWALYHLLYSCQDQKISHIFKGTMYDFFYDHLKDYSAEIVVPTQEIQNNLENILLKKRRVYRYQTDHYNAAAKFDDLNQQNSNQFVLEALAAAMKPDGEVMSRESAVDVLKKTGFSSSKLVPTGLYTLINLKIAQNLIASMMPTLCLKAQPELEKYGVGEIITANSVINWMHRNNLVQQTFEISLSKEEKEMLTDDDSKKDRVKHARP